MGKKKVAGEGGTELLNIIFVNFILIHHLCGIEDVSYIYIYIYERMSSEKSFIECDTIYTYTDLLSE